MKLDAVIYSEKIAIGLFLFSQWYDTPTIIFIYEAKNYPGNTKEIWDNDILEKIQSFGEIKEMNETLAIALKKNANTYDLIPTNYYEDVAKIYSKMNVSVEELEKRKIIFTDLIFFCPIKISRWIIQILEKSNNQDDKRQAFKCMEILANQFNDAWAFYQLAYYYQEGIGVVKNTKPIIPLMRKAASLGDKEAIKWIQNLEI